MVWTSVACPNKLRYTYIFTISANHLGNLVRWEGNGLTMLKDKIGQFKLEK